MGWYDLELVKDVAADASGMPKADTRRNKRGYVKGNLSTIATLEVRRPLVHCSVA